MYMMKSSFINHGLFFQLSLCPILLAPFQMAFREHYLYQVHTVIIASNSRVM